MGGVGSVPGAEAPGYSNFVPSGRLSHYRRTPRRSQAKALDQDTAAWYYCGKGVLPKNPMAYSILTRKGQVTIPKSLRDRLGLNLGDRISFHLRGEEIVLKPVHRTILDLQGSVQPRNRPEDFGSIRRQVTEARGRGRDATSNL